MAYEMRRTDMNLVALVNDFMDPMKHGNAIKGVVEKIMTEALMA